MTLGRGRQREWSGGDEVLTRYGRETSAVFELLGRDEVDLTSALGWTLSRSPLLLAALWARLGLPANPGEVQLALEVADAEGRTDLELWSTAVTVIIEAKRGAGCCRARRS